MRSFVSSPFAGNQMTNAEADLINLVLDTLPGDGRSTEVTLAADRVLQERLPPDAIEQIKQLALAAWRADAAYRRALAQMPQRIKTRCEGRGDLFEAWYEEFEAGQP